MEDHLDRTYPPKEENPYGHYRGIQYREKLVVKCSCCDGKGYVVARHGLDFITPTCIRCNGSGKDYI